MTIQEAIEARHSVRAYKDQPLSEETVKVLEDEIVGSSVMPTTIWSWQERKPMTLMSA